MKSINQKIILALTVLVLIPVSIVGTVLIDRYQSALIETSIFRVEEIADKKVDQITYYLGEKLNDLKILAMSPQMLADAEKAMKAFSQGGSGSKMFGEFELEVDSYYEEFIEIGEYYDLFIISPNGDIVYTVKREKDFGANLFRGSYKDTELANVSQKALMLLQSGYSQYRLYLPSNNEPALFMATPLLEKGEIIGVLALQIDSRKFYEVVTDSTGMGETGETELAQEEGGSALFLMPLKFDSSAAFSRRIPMDVTRPSPIVAALLGERGSGFSEDYRGEGVFAAWRYIPETKMGMVVKIDVEEVLVAARKMKKFGWLSFLGLIGSVILMGLYLARSIIVPIKSLQSATASLASGDFDQKVDVIGKDEIAQLGVSFNKMAKQLYQATARLENLVDERTRELEATNKSLIDEIEGRKEAEKNLLQLTAFQKAILNSSDYSIITTDLNGVIKTFSPASERMLAYTKEEIVDVESPGIFHSSEEVEAYSKKLTKELGKEVKPGFEALVAKPREGKPDTNEWTYIRKDGVRFPVLLSVSPLVDENQKLLGWLGVAADISRLKEVEEELIHARKEAEIANRMKSEFLASMSHEIRTPLNSIIGLSEVLMETELSDEQRRLIQVSYSASETLLHLINDILDLSRIEAGALELNKEPFSIRELLEKVLQIMAFKGKEKNLQILWSMDESIPEWIVGDSGKLRQIIINIIGNAIKFSDRGTIRINLSREKESKILLFKISDEGIGVPKEKQLHIFDRFRQADSSVTRKFGGSGLGLAISKNLVEFMGGRIWVESEEGKGSSFYFTANFMEHKAEIVTIEELSGLNVLVYEKDKVKREKLSNILTSQGALVVNAVEEQEAFDLLAEEHKAGRAVKLILAYCNSEAGSGCLFAERVRKIKNIPQPATLFTVEGAVCGMNEKGKKLGIRCGLSHPAKRENILLAIKEVLKESREKIVDAKNKEPSILLVEDSKDNRLLISAFLKTVPHEMVMAENGLIGVEEFKKRKFDIVLMDVQMPVMDGYTATREIRGYEKENSLPPTPIIALTAHAYKEDVENSIKAGCNEHVTKPIKKAKLMEIIDKYLQSG